MRMVGYIRVSTEEQAREGCSLAFQREAIEAHAKIKGAELLGMFADEGVSGKAMDNRPGLGEALKLACDRGAALCVYSLSRAWRSTRDAIDGVDGLNRYGAELVSLSESIDTTTPAGWMTFRLFASLAEFERDTIRERVLAGMGRARREGRRLTRPERVPYGTRARADDPDRLERDPREWRILRMGLSLRKKGYGYAAIAEWYGSRGLRRRDGTPWAADAVRGMLTKHGNGA